MSTPRRRITIGLIGALALATAFVSCSDTGPSAPRNAAFAIAPIFANDAAGAIDIARIRFVLTRESDGNVVRDTVLQIASGQDSVNLLMTVPVLTTGERFLLTLAMVDAAGDTVFRGGPIEVTPTTSGGAPPVVQVPVVYVGVGFDAASVQILSPDTSTFSGEAVTLTAVALDSIGGPIPGTPIVWRTLDSVQATVPDPDVGQVVGGAARGTARIVAELLTGPRDTVNVGVQPLPSVIVAESGGGQTGSIGASLPQALVARLTAPDGMGVAGLPIVFSVVSGGGSVSIDTVLSDQAGRGSTMWTLGNSAGAQAVGATTARLPGSTATFSATAVGTLSISSGDGQTGTVGAALPQALVALVQDAASNPVQGVQIDWAVTQGNGMVGAASSVTDASGLASTTFTLGTVAGAAHQVTASIGGGTSVAFGATALPGTPATLAYVTQPTAATSGSVIAPPVEVEILDGFANRVTTDNTTDVDIAITSGSGTAGAMLAGTTTQTAVAGLVAFADLAIDLPGSAYTLDASIPSLTLTTSAPFDVTPPTGGVFWTNAGGGNWSVGTNWSTGSPPTALDTAVIALAGTYTVTLDVSDSVAVLNVGGASGIQTFAQGAFTLTVDSGATFGPNAIYQLTAGTLQGVGTVSVQGAMLWDGGTQTEAGITRIEAGGTLVIGTATTKTLNTRTVENLGATTWTDGFISGGNGGTFVNAAGATFDLQADQTFDWGFGATSVFDNQGALTRSVGTGTAFIDAQFDNSGTADLQSGTLQLRGGGTQTGTFTTQPGTSLLFAGGAHTLDATSTFTGNGLVQGFAGTVDIDGTFTVGSPLVVSGASFNVNSTATTDVLQQVGGTIGGSGLLSVTADFSWTGGTQGGTGITRVQPGATLTIGSTSTKTLDTRTVENLGAATWVDGFIGGGNGGTFVNGVGATFDAQADQTFDWGFGTTTVFDNQGTFTRTVGTGTAFIDGAFDNSGTADVQSGTLQLRGGGVSSGSFLAASGATLRFDTGVHDLGAGSSVTGAGTVQVSSGTTTFTDTYAVAGITLVTNGTANFSSGTTSTTTDLTHTAGTVGGTGTLSVTNAFVWSGGTQAGAGVTRLESGGTMTLDNTTKTLNTRTIENAGTATHSAGTVNGGNGGTFVNEPGATYDMSGAVTFDWGFGATSVFDNQGAFTSSANSFMDAVFDHTGTFDVTAGTLQLRNGGTLDAPMVATGTIQLTTGAFTLTDNYAVTGAGTLLLSGATATVSSPDVADLVNFTQSGGTLNGDGQVTITGLWTWTGGTQGGTGLTRLEATGIGDFSGGTKTLDTRTVENAATVTHASGTVNAGNGGTFVNELGAVYDMPAAVTFDWAFGATSVFANQGTLTSSANSFMDAQLNHTGTAFDVSAGTLQMRGGGTLDAPMTATGTIQLTTGAFTLTDNYAVTGTGTVLLSSATATVTSPDVVDFVNFTQSGGTLTGDGQVNITGSWTWTGGTESGTGVTRLENTGTGDFSGGTKTLDTRTVENAATVTHSSGTMNAGAGAVFVNEVGATYDMPAAVTFDWGFAATSVFDNQGTLTSSANSFMDAQLNHTGTAFDVSAGTLQMRGGGTLDAPMTATGTIQLTTGAFTLTDNYAVTGTGTIQLSSATATVTSPDVVDFVNFTQSGGTVDGDGQVTITGLWTWTGGSQLGTGTTRLEAGGTGDLSGGTKTLNTRTIENAGTVAHSTGTVNGGNGGTWVNESGATYDMTAPVTFDWGFGATSVFDNQGTLVHSSAAGTSFMDASLLNVGVFDVQLGTVEARGGFDHADGAVIQGSGTLSIASATVTAFDGDVNPGTSPGILNITGNVTQSALSAINIEVFGTGTTPGVDFDQLNVSGTATLNGTINLIVSAVPTLGDSLPVITFASRAGTLANLFAPPQQSGIIGDTVTTATAFSVVARSQILFAGNDGLVGGVFRVSPNAQDLTNITTEGQGVTDDDYYPRWSPDRTRLTYPANNAPPPFLLHVTSWDGAQIAHPITDTNTARPRFSENTGTGMLHLAATCGDQFFQVQDVCVVPDVSGSIPGLEGIGDGAGKVWVTDAVDAQLFGSGAFAWNPTNPDQMVVARDSIIGMASREASQMWLVNYDGSGVQELTPDVIIDGTDTLRIGDLQFAQPVGAIDWSPDGSFIAFSAINQSNVSSIYRVEVATGAVTRLSTPPGGDDDEMPVISPDGSTILFIRHGFLAEASDWNLFTVPAGGGPTTQVTAEITTIFFGIQEIGYDWSPDGNQIVVTGSDGSGPAVYVIPASTTPATYITNRLLVSRTGSTEIQSSWRP